MDYKKSLCILLIVLLIPYPVSPAALGINGDPSDNTEVEETHHRQKRSFASMVSTQSSCLLTLKMNLFMLYQVFAFYTEKINTDFENI